MASVQFVQSDEICGESNFKGEGFREGFDGRGDGNQRE